MQTLQEQLKCKVVGHIELSVNPTRTEKAVIVTKNPAFGKFIKKKASSWGYNEVTDNTPVINTATKRDVAGKVVFGIVPNYLGSKAIAVVEVRITVPQGVNKSKNKLTLEELEKYTNDHEIYEYVIVKQ